MTIFKVTVYNSHYDVHGDSPLSLTELGISRDGNCLVSFTICQWLLSRLFPKMIFLVLSLFWTRVLATKVISAS